ncbi:Yip1 family protein [Spartinivicinus poritis]|uniref:Yip1 family protein n=1 Tax=Spartinivicinus poritis TaxID=2994640 RepID=A0ABT5U8R1_9GAMM|nr:Yip1 family protein [Spartinivicinus sp. A2-2]MDE1462761.1 Yip1 family protein [Spartinivicinus sp. A2-2]
MILFNHVWGLFAHPKEEYDLIRKETLANKKYYLLHVFILAAIPAVSSYYGATTVGWSIGTLDKVIIDHQSALLMSVAGYMAILAGIVFMGLFIHWMAKTYGTKPSYTKCIVFAAYTATPIYFVGLLALYPNTALYLIGSIIGVAYTVYLLYVGLPRMMTIPEEQGFLFATSVVCVGLVLLVTMKVITALFWGMGFGPGFDVSV